MKNPTLEKPAKSKARTIFECILLAICLSVIVLRATLTEGPNLQNASQMITIADSVFSLSFSAVLLLAFLAWLVAGVFSRKFLYRPTAMEIGLILFVIAGIIATLAASNKRIAITDMAILLGPILLAVLLVQILDSYAKIRIVLVVIAASGIVSAYQCADQYFFENQIMFEQYEQEPSSVLLPIGIQPGSYQHMLFDHQIRSKDVRGFFMTGNSAGSFAIMAGFAALAIFFEKFKNRKINAGQIPDWFLSALAVIVILFGFALTKSKGAIAAFVFAVVGYIPFLFWPRWLLKHRKTILAICVLLGLIATVSLIAYGLGHDDLPGGNSTLVRWQYWKASVKMFIERPFTGVGGGNFVNFYPHHKDPAAIETISDPHNWLLSILSQYGPVGLLGFAAIFLLPLWRTIFPAGSKDQMCELPSPSSFGQIKWIVLLLATAALIFIRPMILEAPVPESGAELIYIILFIHMIPIGIFIIGFMLLLTNEETQKSKGCDLTIAALFCGSLAVLVHSLVDFAIFEPSVFTVLCAMVACLIALNYGKTDRGPVVLTNNLRTKILTTILVIVIIAAYFNFVLIPPAKAVGKIKQAYRARLEGDFQKAHYLLDEAGRVDRVDPTALEMNGREYLQRFLLSESRQIAFLAESEKCLFDAIDRNPASFKNFEKLMEVYLLMAENEQALESQWLTKASEAIGQALELYPGSGRIHFKLAKVAEMVEKDDAALDHYKEAVEIEDSYRKQFRIMYPGREMFSRLGQGNYDYAKGRVAILSDSNRR